MSSFNNQSKGSAVSATNNSKSSTTIVNHVKAGEGYAYDSERTYDQEFDPETGAPMLYDSVGTTPVIVNQSKS